MSEQIVIRNGHQRAVHGERVAVSGTLPVREDDGRVRARAVVRSSAGRVEVFDGDEITLGGTVYAVAVDVAAPGITLTPVGPCAG